MPRIYFGIAGLIIFGAAAAVGFWAMAWRNYWAAQSASSASPSSAAPRISAPASRPQEEVVIRHPTVKHTEGGRLAWQVQLAEVKIAAGAQAVTASEMREALIYDQKGIPIVRLTARTARGNTASRNLEVAGEVRAVSPRGVLITTEVVRWLEQERRLYCPQKVIFRTAHAAVTTTELSYYVDQDIVKAPGAVRMYSGPNKLLGRDLVYNVRTQDFELKNVQAVFNPEQMRRLAPP